MNSLRRRISVAVVGITSLVVAVAAAAIWMSGQALLMNGIDQDLERWAEHMRREPSAEIPRRLPPSSSSGRGWRGDGRRLFQMVDANGKELIRSPGLVEGQTLAPDDGLEADHPLTRIFSDGKCVRTISVSLAQVRQPPRKDESPMEPVATPVIARFAVDVTAIDDELKRMAVLLAVLWAVATILAWGAMLVLRPTILRPLDQLGQALGCLGPDDLAARLPGNIGPEEVRGLVARLNGLLDRLQQAFVREQATIANIAHELRTPVAALRTDIEFRLLASIAEEERAVLGGCLRTVERMQAQVGNLLLLARLESGKEPLQRTVVEVIGLIDEVVERHDIAAGKRGQHFDLRSPTTLTWETSSDHMRLVLDNLVGNAVSHGSNGGVIGIAIEVVDSALIFRIDNQFSGCVQTTELGKPYYRGDGARRDSDHSGLGLALCHRLVRLLGGSISWSIQEDRFVVTFSVSR